VIGPGRKQKTNSAAQQSQPPPRWRLLQGGRTRRTGGTRAANVCGRHELHTPGVSRQPSSKPHAWTTQESDFPQEPGVRNGQQLRFQSLSNPETPPRRLRAHRGNAPPVNRPNSESNKIAQVRQSQSSCRALNNTSRRGFHAASFGDGRYPRNSDRALRASG
jgi:hypothetical protein